MERLTLQEYKNRYGDNPIAEKDHDHEVVLWYTDEKIPSGDYYGIIVERAELDTDSIFDEFISDYDLEDWWDCDGAKEELKEFLKKWNKKHGVDVYYVNEECEVIV